MSALWVPVPPETEREISFWREKYDPSEELYPAHISLVYGSFIPLDQWPAIRPRLVSLLHSFQPFVVQLKDTGVFEGDPCTLWLKPEDNGSLQRLRAALEQNLPEYVQPLPFPFQPHLTIGFFTHVKGLEKVLKRFKKEFIPQTFPVSYLDFIYREEEGKELEREHLYLGE
jgi:2'-5' RNA ligase